MTVKCRCGQELKRFDVRWSDIYATMYSQPVEFGTVKPLAEGAALDVLVYHAASAADIVDDHCRPVEHPQHDVYTEHTEARHISLWQPGHQS